MKNYGRDPDDDVRDIITSEIEANHRAAAEQYSKAAECFAESKRYTKKGNEFDAANEKLKRQLTILNAAFGEAA